MRELVVQAEVKKPGAVYLLAELGQKVWEQYESCSAVDGSVKLMMRMLPIFARVDSMPPQAFFFPSIASMVLLLIMICQSFGNP